MVIWSDIHGRYNDIFAFARANPEKEIIQLGDFGLFPAFGKPEIPDNIKFFVGNHDCLSLANEYSNFLGKYGTYKNFFFVSGAESIDKQYRIEGRDWWPDEEMNYKELQECIDYYSKVKPDMVISHDFPSSAAERMFRMVHKPSRTSQALQRMFEIHRPKFWYGGHWHINKTIRFKNCVFTCLGINEHIELLEFNSFLK